MTNDRPPFWQIKLSAKGQVTVPAEVIAELRLTKGSEYLYLFLDGRVIRVVALDLFPELLQASIGSGDTVVDKTRSRGLRGRPKKS
jgi:bifunctional DNA-binding transcriptional regulator/antitoxin component of YhaV-PrlF toxin-antitoxin module